MEDLHPAVQLLLKRIETHPDEFALSGGRWDKMISRFEPYFTAVEHDAVLAALSRVRLDIMHKELMQEMLNPPSKPDYTPLQSPGGGVGGYSNTVWTTPTSALSSSALSSSLTTSSATATAVSLRELYDRVQANKRDEPTNPLSPKGLHRALKGIFL